MIFLEQKGHGLVSLGRTGGHYPPPRYTIYADGQYEKARPVCIVWRTQRPLNDVARVLVSTEQKGLYRADFIHAADAITKHLGEDYKVWYIVDRSIPNVGLDDE